MAKAAMAMGLLALLCLTGCLKSVVWVGKSPDRRHLVEIVEVAEGQYIQLDGRDGPIFRGIGVETLAFSEDGTKIAYAADRKNGWAVITQENRAAALTLSSRRWAGIGEVLFSPDGHHLAYAAERGGWRVVRDEQEGPVFEALLHATLRWSPDSRHLAYVGQRGETRFVVKDGQIGEGYDGIAALTWSADSARLGYVARSGAWARLVIDGVPGPAHPAILDFALSPRGRRVAYVALDAEAAPGTRRRRWHTVVDGVPGPSVDRVTKLAFDPTGAHLAYVQRSGGRSRVIFDGAEGPAYDDIPATVFAPRGERFAYVARLGERSFVVDRGREGPAHDWIGELVVSPDGQRLGYLARLGGQEIVVHGPSRTALDGAVEGSLVFSRDSRRWACLEKPKGKGVLYIVIDGVPRIPIDLEELSAAVARLPPGERLLSDHTAMMRRWIAAELELSPPRR